METGVLRLTEGCPFRCTYCSVPQVQPQFRGRLGAALAEFDQLVRRGVHRIAFYDDALLFREDKLLLPFLEAVERRNSGIELHTPNALNARFVTEEVAQAMTSAGFGSFYLGFESSSYEWQRKTGSKVYSSELADAVDRLLRAGASPDQITAYLIIAPPDRRSAAGGGVDALRPGNRHPGHVVGVFPSAGDPGRGDVPQMGRSR